MLCIFTIPFAIYGHKNQRNDINHLSMPINMITKETKEIYDNVCVDIDAYDDGFYSLISTIEVHYSHDEISSLYLNDPTLLSFSIPSDYGSGVWILE